MLQSLVRFFKDEEGATAVEYGLIAGLIAVVLIAVIAILGGGFEDAFNYISGLMNPAP